MPFALLPKRRFFRCFCGTLKLSCFHNRQTRLRLTTNPSSPSRAPMTNDAVRAAAQTPLFPLLLRHFEALLLPQPPDPLAVDHEPFVTQPRPDDERCRSRCCPNAAFSAASAAL